MMLKRILFFLLLVFVFKSNAQEISMDGDTSKLPPVLKSYELPDAEWKAWQKTEEAWKGEYTKILKEQKLKMNCNGCESIHMDVVLSIDAEGKLKHYRLLRSNKCSEAFPKALEIRFMKYFFGLKFPDELKGKNFEVRLGTGLKC